MVLSRHSTGMRRIKIKPYLLDNRSEKSPRAVSVGTSETKPAKPVKINPKDFFSN